MTYRDDIQCMIVRWNEKKQMSYAILNFLNFFLLARAEGLKPSVRCASGDTEGLKSSVRAFISRLGVTPKQKIECQICWE